MSKPFQNLFDLSPLTTVQCTLTSLVKPADPLTVATTHTQYLIKPALPSLEDFYAVYSYADLLPV